MHSFGHSNFDRKFNRTRRTIKGSFFVIALLNIAFLVLIVLGIKWLVNNKNEVAKEFGKATHELKESFQEGRAEAAGDSLVIDSLNVQ